MNATHQVSVGMGWRLFAAGVSVIALGACTALRPAASQYPAFYTLDSARDAMAAPVRQAVPAMAPVLIINPPQAAAGFDNARIIYVREIHKFEHYAHSEWVDPPARMLAPLLVAAVENTGAFRAVVLTPSAAAADLRLDIEIVRLQHEFSDRPSRARFTLRAYLVDDRTRRVLAWREFDAAVPAASENAHGGVVAANRAVQTVLEDLAAFCAEAARGLWMKQ